MEKQETARQKKINALIKEEVASLLQNAIRKSSVKNLMISVTNVKITSDLSIAKIYLSIFPNEKAFSYFENIKNNRFQLRHDLSKKMKNQLRKIPEIYFYLDDSLNYIEVIEKELSDGKNPIKDTSSLKNRPKI